MFNEDQIVTFMNGVNTGRMEILKQIKDILDNDDSPLNQLNDIDILVKRYHKEGVI